MCGSLLSSLSFLVWCSYSTAMIESHLLYYYYVVADDDLPQRMIQSIFYGDYTV